MQNSFPIHIETINDTDLHSKQDTFLHEHHLKTGDIEGDESGLFVYGDAIIQYNVSRIPFQKEFRNSRTITIKIFPDQRVIATAPAHATKQAIHEAIAKNARRIWKSLVDFAEQQEHVLTKEYVSGETQFYLGKRYMLKVVADNTHIAEVKLSRGKLLVTINKNDSLRANKVKMLLDNWYSLRAKTVLKKYLDELLPKIIWIQTAPTFRIRSMKKQWGSCSKQGTLIFNPHLVKAPKECIQYVILHELCHIVEHNHSEKFWRLLSQMMPNWKDSKNKLDSIAELYLNH